MLSVSRRPVGKRQKTAKIRRLLTFPHLCPGWPEAGAVYPFRSVNAGSRRSGLIWAVARQNGPEWSGPLVQISNAPYLPRIPGAGSISGRRWLRLHSPAIPFRPHRGGAYGRDSPSSLWEGVSKFHYPPRCPRAQLAGAGSKACVDRSASLSITS